MPGLAAHPSLAGVDAATVAAIQAAMSSADVVRATASVGKLASVVARHTVAKRGGACDLHVRHGDLTTERCDAVGKSLPCHTWSGEPRPTAVHVLTVSRCSAARHMPALSCS